MLSDPKHSPILTDAEYHLLREHIDGFSWNPETQQTRHDPCGWTTASGIQRRPVRRTLIRHIETCPVLNPTTKDTDDMTTDAHKDAARFLRELVGDGETHTTASFALPPKDIWHLKQIAELLDPTPRPPLLDDLLIALTRKWSHGDPDKTAALAEIIQTFQRHVDALPTYAPDQDRMWKDPEGYHIRKADVLNLLKPQESK